MRREKPGTLTAGTGEPLTGTMGLECRKTSSGAPMAEDLRFASLKPDGSRFSAAVTHRGPRKHPALPRPESRDPDLTAWAH